MKNKHITSLILFILLVGCRRTELQRQEQVVEPSSTVKSDSHKQQKKDMNAYSNNESVDHVENNKKLFYKDAEIVFHPEDESVNECISKRCAGIETEKALVFGAKSNLFEEFMSSDDFLDSGIYLGLDIAFSDKKIHLFECNTDKKSHYIQSNVMVICYEGEIYFNYLKISDNFEKIPVQNPCIEDFTENYPNIDSPWFEIWKNLKEGSLKEPPEYFQYDMLLFSKNSPQRLYGIINNHVSIKFNKSSRCVGTEHFPYKPEHTTEAFEKSFYLQGDKFL